MPDSLEENVSCRICLDPKDSYVSLFSHDLSLKVMEVANVQVEKDDGLPGSICTECEYDLEKCYEFRLKVQDADKKLRGNIRMAQFDIEECNIKEEQYGDDGHSDDGDDRDSGSVDDEQFDEEPDVEKNPETTEEATPDPLNHVVVVEEKERKTEMSEEPLNQDEAMAEEVKVQKIEEVALDALSCMKEEAETDIMDVDSNQPDPFGPSSSVTSSALPNPFLILSSSLLGVAKAQIALKMKCNQQPRVGLHSEITESGVNIMTSTNSLLDNDESATTLNVSTQGSQANYDKEETVGGKDSFCLVCDVDCGSSELLKEHESGNSFICRVCTTTFINHDELKKHFFSHPRLMCKCAKFFYCKKDLLLHKSKVSTCNVLAKPHKCKLCLGRFVLRKSLENHMAQKHPNAEHTMFTCLICQRKFKTNSQLRHHLRTDHTAFENVVCDICQRVFGGPEKLKIHVKASHIYSREGCPSCKKAFSTKHALKLHMEKHTGKEIACEVCGELIKGEKSLGYHMKKHRKDITYRCSICRMTFDTKYKRETHHKLVHNRPKQKPAICEICGKEYKSKEVLKHHKATHSSEKPFVCEICGAAFKMRVTLNTHSRIHSDIPKFKCKRCGEGFRWKQTFDKHVLNCESAEDEEMSIKEEDEEITIK